MDGNASPQIPPQPVAPAQSAPANKQDALKQIATSGDGEGSLISQLFNNPFFTAGFGLAGLGAALRYGTQGLRVGASMLRQRMLVDLEITRHDESYNWVLNWMTAQYQNQLAPTGPRKKLGAM
ncbi:hypothetical protein KC336_g18810, partial [Hortaea werneckii]